MAIDIDSDGECSGEKFGLFAGDERDMEVYSQDTGSEGQPLLAASEQEKSIQMQEWDMGANSVSTTSLLL